MCYSPNSLMIMLIGFIIMPLCFVMLNIGLARYKKKTKVVGFLVNAAIALSVLASLVYAFLSQTLC